MGGRLAVTVFSSSGRARTSHDGLPGALYRPTWGGGYSGAARPFDRAWPDPPPLLHAADGLSAHFVHNEYLQAGADSGIIGLGLVGLVALSLAKALRRVDLLSACAVAAVVCWAVAGLFDFDWHLPVVGFVGGWCAGLAAREFS